jgi:Holliday junction resolvase RusA-like endonuclease
VNIIFFVPGLPVPKGSAKGFYNTKLKRVMIVQDNAKRQKPWASMISYAAQEQGVSQIEGPVFVGMLFQLPRPKSHYRVNGTIKHNAPIYHIVKPDVDKLARCVFDSLSMIWRDDSQGQITEARKIYADQPGVWITISNEYKGDE